MAGVRPPALPRPRGVPTDQAIEELAQHVEETWRAAKASGRTDEDALAAARAELSNPPRLPPSMTAPRRSGLSGWLSAFGRDVRHAVRLLRARPGFSAVAVITLALGIGANTAIFSVVRAMLLEPLPFPRSGPAGAAVGSGRPRPVTNFIVSAPNYLDWRRNIKSFEQTAIWESLSFNLSGDGEAERVPGMRVSALRILDAWSTAATRADVHYREKMQPGHDVVVISDGLWRRRFGGRPDIVGQTTRINGRSFQIVGVMPPTFRFTLRGTSVWIPIAFTRGDSERDSHSFFAAARLRDGVTLAGARAELDGLGRSLAVQYPSRTEGRPRR